MFDTRATNALLDAAGEAQLCERAAVGRRLIAVGRFTLARHDEVSDDKSFWAVDEWDNTAAHVAIELGVGRGLAATWMDWGITLVERFPKLGAAMEAGSVDVKVFREIDKRTELICDKELLAILDAKLCTAAPTWNRLSCKKIAQLVDWMVIELDPDAIRASTDRRSNRFLLIKPGAHGMAEIYGRLPAVDGAIIDARITALANSVCRNDPRTSDQRRADAMVAVAAGVNTLTCQCGTENCLIATAEGTPAGAQVVIHVMAENATLTGQSAKPGYLAGLGAVPAEVMADLAAQPWVRIKPLAEATALGAEASYRPSQKLADFIRCRDVTCRFPDCDQPAYNCDLDHVVPWPSGPTHPGNLACLCRFHHLLKTFYSGDQGWSEVLHPDGTIVWTTPAGRQHVTKPYGAQYFPQLAMPVGPATASPTPPPKAGRELCMPNRKHSRADNRAAHINAERAVNRTRREANPPPF